MDKALIYPHCRTAGADLNIRPSLLLAICQQESSFNESEMRLENGFYRKYTRPMRWASTTEALFAVSYGLMQVMGQSLYEDGFFRWHFEQKDDRYRAFYDNDEMHEIHVVKAINALMDNPEWQVRWGAIHLSGKLRKAKGEIPKALLYYNGGGNPHYDDEVLAKETQLMKGLEV